MTIGGVKSSAPELAAQAAQPTSGKVHKQPDKAAAQKLDAARKFEALLVQQLLQVMRQTAKSGGLGSSSGASGQYLSMFDGERMAEGGGIGLAGMLSDALTAAEGGEAAQQLVTTQMQNAGASVSAASVSGGVSAPLPNP